MVNYGTVLGAILGFLIGTGIYKVISTSEEWLDSCKYNNNTRQIDCGDK